MSCHIKSATLAVAIACISSSAFAEIPDAATVVVVATRQASRVAALAADVSVIERDAIEAAGPAATLGDLLAGVPGVELSRQGSRGASEAVFIRGANAGHTLVLVDGLRIGSATLGATALESLPLSQIERIEILRGPASALYGSDAIGGVIRITTRPGTDAPTLDARAGIGNHGTHEASLAHAGRRGNFSYAVRAGETRSDGVNVITNAASPAYNNDRDGYWRRHLAADLAWQPDDTTEFGLHWLDSAGANKFDTSWPSATLDWRTRQDTRVMSAHARHRVNTAWTTALRLGRGEDTSTTSPSFTAGQPHDRYITRQDQLVWQNDILLPLGRGLVALETLREAIDSTNVYTDTRRSTDSLVLGWNGDMGAHVWQFGLRHDSNSQYGAKTTHSANYGYRFAPGWRVSAGVGTAFKAPTFNDLYFPNTPFVGSSNPTLAPEEAKSREAALHYGNARSEASLTAFRNDIRNLIQWQESAPGSFFYTPVNIGTARITGLTAAGKLLLGEWTLGAHATFQSPQNRDSNEILIRRARQFGKLALERKTGRWSYGTELVGAGRRYDAPDFITGRNTQKMGGYGIINLHGEYRVDARWSLFGRIDNLFDKHYELAANASSQYASLGASAFFGVRFVMK
jgi:vitamin B12 transporter